MTIRTIALGVTGFWILACSAPTMEETSVHPTGFPIAALAGATQESVMPFEMMGVKTTTIVYKDTDQATCFAGQTPAEAAGFKFENAEELKKEGTLAGSKGKEVLSFVHKDSQCIVTWVVQP